MPELSERSLAQLATLDPRLKRVCEAAIKRADFVIVCGYRGKADQDKAVAEGKSKASWPNSKHNSSPSLAVDVAPYPIDWKDLTHFKELACVILETASHIGVPMTWGGNWTKFRDYPHFEIAEPST